MTILAKLIHDSYNPYTQARLTTFEFEYPRFIHAEFMTHRMLAKNSASSRAIPVLKMIESIEDNVAMPIHWGKAQAGMQAKEELDSLIDIEGYTCTKEEAWAIACNKAVDISKAFAEAGYHKQIVNRLTEPFQHMKVVATGTDWNNVFWLRDHDDAQPEIHDLIHQARVLYENNAPVSLYEGELHVPYLHRFRKLDNYGIRKMSYSTDPEGQLLLDADVALKISASMCAQVSYRKADDSLEKALMIYDRLVNSKPVHASPFEHQGICFDPRDAYSFPLSWPEGVTHVDREEHFYSGNLRGWIQHRQLIPDNVMKY